MTRTCIRKTVTSVAQKITSTRYLCKANGSLQDRTPSKNMNKGPQESQRVHFTKEFAKMPSDINILRKMSRKIPSSILSNDEEGVVNWSSGVVKTIFGDTRDSSEASFLQTGPRGGENIILRKDSKTQFIVFSICSNRFMEKETIWKHLISNPFDQSYPTYACFLFNLYNIQRYLNHSPAHCQN